jgi:hypothetical protein
MKYILVITLVCFSLITVGCGVTNTNDLFEEREIEDIANRYLNAALMGDINLAKSCLHPESPFQDTIDLRFQQLSSALADLHSTGCSFTVKINFSNISITGETAVGTIDNYYICVWCSLYDNGCQYNYQDRGEQVLFKKYNGKWLGY